MKINYFDKDTRAFDKFSKEIDINHIVRYARANDKSKNDKERSTRELALGSHLEKHEKYLKLYKSSEVFWGLGIENEFYLECASRPSISNDFFNNNHQRERYSVNYYSNYDQELKTEAFKYTNHTFVDIPYLINSHSFTDADINSNHKTLAYVKKQIDKSSKTNNKLRVLDTSKTNPEFNGKTLGEEIFKSNEYLRNNFNKTWLYDGDTFEITTLNFYKTDVHQMIGELVQYKQDFIDNIQKFQTETKLFESCGQIKIMEKNYPFALHMTNPNNIGIFNNGTLHYNLTLPTELDSNKLIKNPEQFTEEHKQAIKIIQWFEPILVSIYGTPDYFSQLSNYPNAIKFSGASQRCAVSRYISLGTYDTDQMQPGKILLTPLTNFPDYFWYNQYHENSAYNKLEKIGLDVNFNKHYNHGIELRFFDHISDPKLIFESFEFIIYLIDLAFENSIDMENPIKNKLWNKLVSNVMTHGKNYNLTDEELTCFELMLGLRFSSSNIVHVYNQILAHLKSKFEFVIADKKISIGKFSKHVLMPEKIMVLCPNKGKNIGEIKISLDTTVNLVKFSNIISELSEEKELPNEIINIVEIVDGFVEINDNLEQLSTLNGSKQKTAKLLSDINQIIKTSIDVLNYNIEKILENKNKITTTLFVKIIDLIGCFKLI